MASRAEGLHRTHCAGLVFWGKRHIPGKAVLAIVFPIDFAKSAIAQGQADAARHQESSLPEYPATLQAAHTL